MGETWRMNNGLPREIVHVPFKSLLKISEIRERTTYKPEDTSGMRLSMGGRMSQNISDVFMTFFSFSDVLRTSTDLSVQQLPVLVKK